MNIRTFLMIGLAACATGCGEQEQTASTESADAAFPDALQPHIDNMRNAARAVADAVDISAARSAAQGITESCSGCHVTAGVKVDLSSLYLQ